MEKGKSYEHTRKADSTIAENGFGLEKVRGAYLNGYIHAIAT